MEFNTSATLLRNLSPRSQYYLDKTDTIVKASFCVETLANMAWLRGGGFDLLRFYIHGVCFKDVNGALRKGT
jgi:hypothetical protein